MRTLQPDQKMIHLYATNIKGLPDPGEAPNTLDYLCGQRREKALQYRQPDDRRRCLGAGLLLRKALPLHGASPEDIQINSNGKPVADNIHFNLSHSAHWAICAVSEKRVGCDIEKITEEPKGLAQRFFHQNEADYLNACDKERRRETFFRLWTLKESYIKMTGEGLHLPLDCFEILLGSESITLRRDGRILPCRLMEYQIPGYKVSVCGEEKHFEELVEFEASDLLRRTAPTSPPFLNTPWA